MLGTLTAYTKTAQIIEKMNQILPQNFIIQAKEARKEKSFSFLYYFV